MKGDAWKVVALIFVASVLFACQAGPDRITSAPAGEARTSIEAEFDRTVRDFLAQSHRDGIQTPQAIEKRLGLDVLRENPRRREEVSEAEIAQLHPVLRKLDMAVTEPHFDPYAFMIERYVEDGQFGFRDEAILLLTVFGYESAETNAIRRTWDY